MVTDGTMGAVEMKVADVWQSQQGAGVPMNLVLLEEIGGTRLLAIKVGPGEGWAIAQHVYRLAQVRPPTYTLMATLVRESGAHLRDVAVTRLAEGTIYATIALDGAGKVRTVDARPSDALGLALAAELPIRADPALLATAGITADPPDLLKDSRDTGANLVIEDRKLTLAPAQESADGASAATAPVNLDFAAGLEGWRLAGNLPQEYDLTAAPDAQQAGSAAISLRAKNPNPDGFGTILQWCSAGAYRGARVRFSAEVKAEEVVGQAGLWMRIDGPGQTLRYANVTWSRHYALAPTLGFDNMYARPIKGTQDWQRYAVVLDVPEASAALYYGLLLHGGGQVWLAGVRVEVVGPDVPVTG